ncbi:MAG: PhnA domain-containing protein [Crocinitomicaceae bacterium]|nr:PhnA domain-containing protein [Crocinitomicaceae bacterium]
MSLDKTLHERSNSTCEICGSKNNLSVFNISLTKNESADESALLCSTCTDQISNPEKTDAQHWRCLNDCMWSEVPAVKIISWRMLNRLRGEGWPNDLLDMLYLNDDELKLAQATGEGLDEEDKIIHKDSNGALLANGDTVVLIKDLDVKGGGFTAKRGTAVRNIMLVDNNAEHIEGKVEGQHIVILTKYVKKSN